MGKINVVPVMLSRETLEETLQKLSKVNVVAIVTDGDEKTFTIGEKKIPRIAFATLPDAAFKYKDCLWLIGGCVKGREDISRAKKFLMIFGVPEKNIINFEVAAQISETWLANLNYIEERGADFFATGNEYTRDCFNMKYLPRVQKDKGKSYVGVNLADDFQDLRQSYLTAKYVFEHVEPGSIKFVIIGLSPYSFRYDNAKDFANQKNLQYMFDLRSTADSGCDKLIGITPFDFMRLCRFKAPPQESSLEESDYDGLLKNLFGDDVKDMLATTAQADLNFDGIKAELDCNFSEKAVADWENDKKFLTTDDEEKNIQILKDYIELCLANGAKPFGILFPYAPAKRKNYDKTLLSSFRETIAALEENYDFMCVDLFDRFNYNCFCDMTRLNSKGMLIANSLLYFKLCTKNLIPPESFCDMNYDYFYQLSWVVTNEEYNDFMARIFKASARMIRRKRKVKIAFALYDASIWCGDDLYNLFARDENFETSILFCLRADKPGDETVREDFLRGVEQFKAHGLNVVAVENWKEDAPAQDVLIFLTPYIFALSSEPLSRILTPKTLITYVPYALDVTKFNFYKHVIFHIAWKLFFYSAMSVKEYDKQVKVGMPRGFYSGHPKIDGFFDANANFSFRWKIARAKTKKIIWAPHWSISEGVMNSTFQWNYKFMYDFAKAHPEISWVVKPHPNLYFSAVQAGLFPSVEAFKEYLQAWDDLPNAQVYEGAYYQAIFATSDGMIHDSSSFVAEYQYVDKPMIFLTRPTQKFYELGEKIVNASYTVDGKNLKEIAALIQQVFIDDDDYKAQERKEIFDKYLNYPKDNGMTASEFIFKKIADEIKNLSLAY